MAVRKGLLDRKQKGRVMPAGDTSRRVLVTGHRGYLGSVMLPRFAMAGWTVEGLDSDLYADCDFAAGGPLPYASWRRMDIRDVAASDLAGYHAIIHLAGLSNDPLGNLAPDVTDEINHHATARLATAAKAAGVERFLFASSCSNYGAAGDAILSEDAPVRPVTAYGRSKVDAETALGRLQGNGFHITSLRLATVYGLSPRLRFDLVINNLIAWALGAGTVHLKSDGTSWRPLVHAEDVADAFLAVLEAPSDSTSGQALNVVPDGENYRVADVARMVSAAIPTAHVSFAKGAGTDLRNYRVDGSRLLRLVDWRPQWTVARGIAQLVAALRIERASPDDFEGPRFQRLAHLQRLQDEGRLDDRLRPDCLGSAAA